MPHGEAFPRFKIQPQFPSKSVTCGLTIFARFARTDVNALAIVHLYFNGLVATVATNVKTHIVTAFFQFADDFVWNSTLDFNVTAARHFFSRRFVIALVLPARSVTCFLHVQTKIDLIRQDLNVPLRLHSTAHHAERFPRFSISHHKTRNDGVDGTFARRVNVGVVGFHRDTLAAILKHEAESRHNDPTAHAAVITLNERDHIALIVRRAHVNSVAVIDCGMFWHRGCILWWQPCRLRYWSVCRRRACLYSLRRAIRIDQLPP